jgi:predicted DCC family thiol-disulfide oxidoreductase YuxK
MDTLRNHTILYDDECPACTKYTQAFVHTEMLDHKGRQPFTKMRNVYKGAIDWQRASDEIALIDHDSGKVTYGVESLFKIIGNAMPLFKPLFAMKLLQWLMKKVYFFISYNRKAIVPGKVFEGYNTCSPTLNLTYRWAYIGFAWLLTSWVLTSYVQLLTPLVPATNFWREFVVCGGQIAFQAIFVRVVFRQRLIHYLGNLMTVSLAGAILLLPMILMSGLVGPHIIYLLYFLLIVAAMCYEHARRVKILELPWYITGTWILYRLIVLYIIF